MDFSEYKGVYVFVETMEGNKVTVISINPFGGDNGSARIAPDIA